MDSAINYSQFVLLIQLSYGLATKTGGANGETRLRGMRDTGSHFYFGRLSRRRFAWLCRSHQANIRIGESRVNLLRAGHEDWRRERRGGGRYSTAWHAPY
jgi:hypothetical protein